MELKSEKEIVEMAPSKLHAYFESVAQEMAQYERVMAQNQFTRRADFEARYSGLGGASHWRRHYQQDWESAPKKAKPSYHGTYTARVVEPAVAPLDFEKAKPFIRAVIERMLDLLSDEEHWVKGAVHRREDGVDKYCLIGAQERALQDLTLGGIQDDPVVEQQRQRVIVAIKAFMNEALKETGHGSMPGFNDSASTEFEDVRLWLKGMLGRLDD